MEGATTIAVIATILALFFGLTALLVQRKARRHHEAAGRKSAALPPQPRIRARPATAAASPATAAPAADHVTEPEAPAKAASRPVFKVYTGNAGAAQAGAQEDDEEYVWE